VKGGSSPGSAGPSAEHAVCVLDAAGKVTARFTIKHCAEGIASLVRRLARYGDAADLPVAIERPSGRLVDLLLEAGHPVVPVSPDAIKTWREGEVLSGAKPGAKSDAGDAAVIAGYLRPRSHRLVPAVPSCDETRAWRTVVRTRDDLAEMRVAATSQRSALLEAHWPGATAIFADAGSPISREFLTRYPTPAAARHLGEKRMAAVLVKHGYCGRKPAVQLLDRLRQAPPGSTGEALTEALRDAVLALVAVLQAVNGALKDLDRSVAAHLGEHSDGKIFTSLPRPGQINAAQMLAEWGDCRQAYAGPDSVAALAGVTPVTRQSGKHRGVEFRWACTKRFRRAVTTFADNSRHASPWAAQVYAQARASGKDHPHATRILARAWIRVIWPCRVNGVPYDPARHGAAAALARQGSSRSSAAVGPSPFRSAIWRPVWVLELRPSLVRMVVMWVCTVRSDKNSHDARHGPTLIAAARSQMAASFPRGTFSQAELTADESVRSVSPAPDERDCAGAIRGRPVARPLAGSRSTGAGGSASRPSAGRVSRPPRRPQPRRRRWRSRPPRSDRRPRRRSGRRPSRPAPR
jgi:transposase